MSKTFEVKIKSVFDDKIITLPVAFGTSVGNLKDMFGKVQKADASRICFYHDGQQLLNDVLVPSQSQADGTTPILHAVISNTSKTRSTVKNAIINTPPKLAPEELRSAPKVDKYKTIEDNDEIKITENMVRLAWKAGSWVEIFSNTKRKWYLGHIVKKFDDTEGEWLEIGYETERNGQSMRKQVQRFCQDVRPINQSAWKNRMDLPPKMAQAAENQKEIHRDVRKCVKTVNACLERPIDLANINHQIKECQKVMEDEGRLYLGDRLRQKLKILNGSALEVATTKAQTHLDIIALEKAIAQYGAFSNPVEAAKAKEKLKELQTNRYDSMIKSAVDPKDIPTLSELLTDPILKRPTKDKIKEKLKELKNKRLLQIVHQAQGLQGIKDITKQMKEDLHLITEEVKVQVDHKLQDLRTNRINALLQIDDLTHLEKAVEEWADVLDERTKITVDRRVQELRTFELSRITEQTNDFTSIDLLIEAAMQLEMKTDGKYQPNIDKVIVEAQEKVKLIVTEHLTSLLKHSDPISNEQLVELEIAYNKGHKHCPPALSKRLNQHIKQLCEASLTRCIREGSEVDPSLASDKVIDNLVATYKHTHAKVPLALSSKARDLLGKLSTNRLKRIVDETKDTDELKNLRARFENDSEFASEAVKKEAQEKIEVLLERQLNDLVIQKGIPRNLVVPGGGNIMKEFDSFEKKMDECNLKFRSVDDIPELMKLLKSTQGLENLAFDRRMRELRAERLRKRVINATPLTVDDYEGFHRQDEDFCEYGDKTASKEKIRGLRIERLKEIMDMALDPASALEKEIRASSLWVEEELKQMARNLLFNLRQDSIKKQVVAACEKTKKQISDNQHIPDDALQLVNSCLVEMAKVLSSSHHNLSNIEPFSQSLHDVKLHLLVLQHYQLRQNWIVGSKVERLEDGEWRQGEITEVNQDPAGVDSVVIRADNAMNTERYSRLDTRIRPSQPGIEPVQFRQMKLRRCKIARYGVNISDVEEQKEEEMAGYQKFLGVERERKKRDLIEQEPQIGKRWEGSKAKGWTADNVIKWLKSLGKNYAKYESTFRAQNVTGPILLELNSNDLIELQVGRLHRKKMKIEIQKLRSWNTIEKVSKLGRKLNKRRNTMTIRKN